MKITTPWDEHFMLPAFLGCVHWALGEPEVLARFREDTGSKWEPSTDAMGQMIDRASGADRDFMQCFINWVASDIFGTPADLKGAE